MDVCLVLTHRCNLACGYCYAGEHHGRQMEDEVLDRAVDLLHSDGAARAQLSFFGGEPFLRFPAMRRAVERARRAAEERGAQLLLQCTTNGTLIEPEHARFAADNAMRITVSIDGVREAHELHRPRAGGGSSFDACHRGLRRLLDGGARTDALMVISPQTVSYVYRSAGWLWSEGVQVVRANLVLDAPWETQDRNDLREQLWAVAAELMARRQAGQLVEFEPFAAGMSSARARPSVGAPARPQVVVATGGDLYPCAPMVGEDRANGPEAALRIGHLSDGAPRIAESVARGGAGCERGGKACACAAYLETGSRDVSGPMGLWYGRVCREMGAAIAGGPAGPARAGTGRRPFLFGLAAAAGGAALAAPALMRAGLFDDPHPAPSGCPRPAHTTEEPVPPPLPEPDGYMTEPSPPEPSPPPPGQMLAPPEPPPPPPEPPHEERIMGDMAIDPDAPRRKLEEIERRRDEVAQELRELKERIRRGETEEGVTGGVVRQPLDAAFERDDPLSDVD